MSWDTQHSKNIGRCMRCFPSGTVVHSPSSGHVPSSADCATHGICMIRQVSCCTTFQMPSDPYARMRNSCEHYRPQTIGPTRPGGRLTPKKFSESLVSDIAPSRLPVNQVRPERFTWQSISGIRKQADCLDRLTAKHAISFCCSEVSKAVD